MTASENSLSMHTKQGVEGAGAGASGAARAVRALVVLAGLAGLLALVVLAPHFATTYLFPDRDIEPEKLAVLNLIRWLAVGTGVALLIAAWQLPRLLGERRYATLSAEHLIKVAAFLFPGLVVVLTLFVKARYGPREPTYMDLIAEDSVVQNVSVIFSFLAAGLAALAARDFFRREARTVGYLYVLLGAGLLFMSLEEISWGQRIFGVESPEWFLEHNTQQEITVHNLGPVQAILHKLYIVVGLYGSLAWFLLVSPSLRSHWLVPFIVPQWWIASYFFPVGAFYAIYDYTSRWGIFIARDQEVAEFLLSLGFLLFVADILIRLRAAGDRRHPDRVPGRAAP